MEGLKRNPQEPFIRASLQDLRAGRIPWGCAELFAEGGYPKGAFKFVIHVTKHESHGGGVASIRAYATCRFRRKRSRCFADARPIITRTFSPPS